MDELIQRLRQFRDERDWGQFHTPKDLAISVNIEAAELLELFQWRSEKLKEDEELVEKTRSEAADVFLYLLMFCDTMGIDLAVAAHEKISQNQSRFPVDASYGVAKPNDYSE